MGLHALDVEQNPFASNEADRAVDLAQLATYAFTTSEGDANLSEYASALKPAKGVHFCQSRKELLLIALEKSPRSGSGQIDTSEPESTQAIFQFTQQSIPDTCEGS